MSALPRLSWSVVLSVLCVVVGLVTSRAALAQGGAAGATAATGRAQTIHVLAIDSDDADEQADGLTAALRSHVRETPGWTLLETTQSLSMLTAAFRCPQHPDSACLERIGDKLKADQLIWGVLTKSPGHQVTAEVHLWRRGNADQVARESYSDNLRDAGDEGLRRVATQLFGKLVGVGGGTLVLHASGDKGNVLVDGEVKATLVHGRATVSAAAGPHVIEIQAPGYLSARRDVVVQSGGNNALEIVLEVDPNPPATADTGKPLPVRKIVGWSSIAAGAILVGVGVGFGFAWESDESDITNLAKTNYGDGNTKVINPCSPPTVNGTTYQGCQDLDAAHRAVAGEVVTFTLGGLLAATGIYLLVTDPSGEAPTKVATKSGWDSLHFAPSLGPGNGSMLVTGRF